MGCRETRRLPLPWSLEPLPEISELLARYPRHGPPAVALAEAPMTRLAPPRVSCGAARKLRPVADTWCAPGSQTAHVGGDIGDRLRGGEVVTVREVRHEHVRALAVAEGDQLPHQNRVVLTRDPGRQATR